MSTLKRKVIEDLQLTEMSERLDKTCWSVIKDYRYLWREIKFPSNENEEEVNV